MTILIERLMVDTTHDRTAGEVRNPVRRLRQRLTALEQRQAELRERLVRVETVLTDDEYLASQGAVVCQFDHTVTGSPSTASRVRFSAIGVGEAKARMPRVLLADLTARVDPWREPAWLLMDVEGAE